MDYRWHPSIVASPHSNQAYCPRPDIGYPSRFRFQASLRSCWKIQSGCFRAHRLQHAQSGCCNYRANAITITGANLGWIINRFAYSESTRLAPTNAGVLFFHPRPQEILPQAKVEMARFDRASARNFHASKSCLGQGIQRNRFDSWLGNRDSSCPRGVEKSLTLAATMGRITTGDD